MSAKKYQVHTAAHPVVLCPSEAVFKWLVKADVNRLAERGAATRNVLHLHPNFLDPLDNGSHHVTATAVQDEGRGNGWLLGTCLFAKPLTTTIAGSNVPSAVIVIATITRLVSSAVMQM